jgi:amidase
MTPTAALPPDTAAALIAGPALLAAGADSGPLGGLTFVAKDLFDVAGWRTGAGNPDWLAAASPATEHAEAVRLLLASGASLIGKAHTDELAFSLTGCNVHYGAPHNPAAPGRMPGGSSSGSAVAVASGLSDIGLGSDTGGSVRVPASYCGILGHRPTHGRVPLTGAVALAPSFDTAGLLARSGTTLRAGMLALLAGGGSKGGATSAAVRRLLLPSDALAQLDEESRGPWWSALSRFGLPIVDTLLAEEGSGIDEWRAAFQALQAAEAWAGHGAWFELRHPAVSAEVERRFRAGSTLPADALDRARRTRQAVRARLSALLRPSDLLVIPAACGLAPPLTLEGAAVDDVRQRTLNLTCIAGLSGAPSVSLPLATVDGLPLGVCLVGLPGHDEVLLDLAARLLP